jgi:hypothetical protein
VFSSARRAFLCRFTPLVVGALLCAALVGSAAGAPASGGGHLPYFSLLNEWVASKKLPAGIAFSFGRQNGVGKSKGAARVWFGEVKRPGLTIIAAGRGHAICESIEREAKNGTGTGHGRCMPLAGARELEMLTMSENCRGGHIRVTGLVPNGVTGLKVEGEDGTTERIVPVTENVVDFPVENKKFVLHGVGSPAAERLEWGLPVETKRRRVSVCTVGIF